MENSIRKEILFLATLIVKLTGVTYIVGAIKYFTIVCQSVIDNYHRYYYLSDFFSVSMQWNLVRCFIDLAFGCILVFSTEWSIKKVLKLGNKLIDQTEVNTKKRIQR